MGPIFVTEHGEVGSNAAEFRDRAERRLGELMLEGWRETILRSGMARTERLGVIVLYDRLRAVGNAISGPQGQVVAATASAEPIVLECDSPGAGTPGVHIGWGSSWHGFVQINNNWTIDDYTFQRKYPDYKMTISRSSGAIVQEDLGSGNTRTGKCQLLSKNNNRF